MTQEELAFAVGATKRQIGAWERGENDIPMDYAVSIADILDCSVDDIAGRVRRPSHEEEELLRLFRNSSRRTKDAIMTTVRAMSKI